MAGTVRPAAVALGAAAAGVTLWATVIERQLFTVRRHTLPILPTGASPIRILQLSDLHLAPWQNRKIDWVRSLVELRPDLVVLTGDLMGHLEARHALIHALRPLAEQAPTVFVHGSNDYYGPRFKNPVKYLLEPSRLSTRVPDIDNAALTAGLSGIGAIDLNNTAARFEVQGTTLELLGLNDPHIRYDDVAAMREAHAALPEASGEIVRLGVVHAPYQEALGELLRDETALILAGHTHGGQVRVPGVGAMTSNCDLPPAQARGLSVWHDAHRAAFLNVSAGLGNSIYAPVRFACRPEASLLTLEAAA
ncbi:metallophosphoesterase [Leucobacter chromiireducens]|uniref:metallophosphoesterase n=1 Tax=Leucobacter chromiireducens TaxID=283877 RepID=UPI000F63A3D6|nr:metallophosphoesterase [Leucobacter chromiireducens]